MTKKDYELIAGVLANSGVNEGSVERIALLLASELAKDNPRFDRARFLKATKRHD